MKNPKSNTQHGGSRKESRSSSNFTGCRSILLPAFVSLKQQLIVYVARTIVALLLEIKKMAEKDGTEEVNDLTQCPVCFESYEEDGDHIPRILPCHCTLCQGCIGKLLKNNALECPQDRQKHKAERGVKSFSQNKYIVAYLKREMKDNIVEYDQCSEHSLKIALYCKEKGCEFDGIFFYSYCQRR